MKFFIVFISFASMVFAQENEALKFFPYKTGDMWEYDWYDLEFPDTLQNFNIKDSVDTEGNIFVTQTARFINPILPGALLSDTAIYKIDTSFNVFCLTCPIENQFLYKLNAQQGDKWIVFEHPGGNGFEMAIVRSVWEDELFGSQTIFKNYVYYYAPDSSDTLGSPNVLVRYGDILAKETGLYFRGAGDAVGSIYLKGCVINDTLFGDTTFVVTSVNDFSEIPNEYVLFPNFPNPFNPSTNIRFEIPERSNVSIKVYNILGKEITTLLDKEMSPGNYSLSWDAKDSDGKLIPSGVYLIRFSAIGGAGNYTKTLKALLLK